MMIELIVEYYLKIAYSYDKEVARKGSLNKAKPQPQ